MNLFGREPVFWFSLLYSAVSMLSAFVFHAGTVKQGAINAVGAAVVGLLTAAVAARDGLPAAIMGLMKAALALGLAFGLHLDAGSQAILMSFASTVIAMFLRTQITAPVTADGLPAPGTDLPLPMVSR